ncbi:MAG: aminotransferase class IV [Bacteroidales bacterium]|nr:aminotransferase class IV [Bacteroidales bacterium]
MCLLLETIRVKDGRFCHLKYHQERMNQTRAVLFPGSGLLDIGAFEIPVAFSSGIFKCRIVYDRDFREIEFLTYTPKRIDSLHLVEAENLKYPFKLLDRSGIETLQKDFRESEEIILVQKGVITDTSYSNLAFLSENQWFTPDKPLLNGTCRQRLISQGMLTQTRITPETIALYSHVSLINSMLGLTDLMLPVSSIH